MTTVVTEKPEWVNTPRTWLWRGNDGLCDTNYAGHGSWDLDTALRKFINFDSSQPVPEPIERYWTGDGCWVLYPNDVVYHYVVPTVADGDCTQYLYRLSAAVDDDDWLRKSLQGMRDRTTQVLNKLKARKPL